MSGFQRGFKAQANRLALGLRKQRSLSATDPLDPRDVFHSFSIPVMSLSDFQVSCPEDTSVLLSGPAGFSAVLFPVGNGQRLVIHNDSHSPARQNSNLAHELSHVLLGHSSEMLCTGDLSRRFNSPVEAEAAYLGGCLLVPNEAAHRITALRTDPSSAALKYGVSEDMIKYRCGVSGGYRRSGRSRL